MKTVLCYGDSNTWGYVPFTAERLAWNVRWTGILQALLGDQFRIIEEGLRGRTTVWDDPFKPDRNGFKTLIPLLDSHMPLDLVVLMLGTNDLKHIYGTYAADAARGANRLIEVIQQRPCGIAGQSPAILLVAPPIMIERPPLKDQFRGCEEKSGLFGECYRAVADTAGVGFIDASDAVREEDLPDGVHFFTAPAHCNNADGWHRSSGDSRRRLSGLP